MNLKQLITNKSFFLKGFLLWVVTTVGFIAEASLFTVFFIHFETPFVFLLIFIGSFVFSFPAFFVLLIGAGMIKASSKNITIQFRRLFIFLFSISLCYGVIAGFLFNYLSEDAVFNNAGIIGSISIMVFSIFSCTVFGSIVLLKPLFAYFTGVDTSMGRTELLTLIINNHHQKINNMETSSPDNLASSSGTSARILIKGIITGILILVMLIPSFYLTSLVTERQQRQTEVVKEVSSKWASEQTISGPYLVIPYTDVYTNDTGKIISNRTNLIIFPDNLQVNGELIPEKRQRSIYKVLLYKSSLAISGSFKTALPAEIDPGNIDFAAAKICFGLNDFKGLEEEIKISFNKQSYVLTPGLPLKDINEEGLSVPVSLSREFLTGTIPFNLRFKIRGSEKLHFLPLAANSKFELNSSWPNPSFDGNILPNDRIVKNSGFNAVWSFNRANLPFTMVMKQGKFNADDLSFGVSMVQPADQYEKTMRSVKYAILFIGLTFALFFIIESLQKKPFHPVQYVLVGLALLIFYTLLLSISEFILFDYAYGIAALATIFLISLYAKSHFLKWSIAGTFGAALCCLYGFIFILIRLEDTALLIGSIGLFIILSVVMYISRKIKWYGSINQVA